ncbi:alpha-(1-_3)-arabinofuranosyltransferase [Streptomonospora nanhaiensis]|uniref:alpha-(1->3)-arabinofuranosyltransferase n=1 Tax=Streptomonospora nanhaiensis TaxID=1323731 RepID=UPI001C3848F5|nr:alpha-(1->3)-arabinofuranosyltransferase [Streptomonospora nanhaiensis]MBV2362137.1 alpha-(1->3)-arabinofuranosyltransferase [Streptomonospora nanhaiensis]MBV2364791.1 alpha-(1->3)-arabinofuranosyltransferase [Streptomonospora nanhaiensis]
MALSLNPPMIVGDTKIDLTVNPFGFLYRALYLWDPAYFGQLQNQAYGYFFPNGPFHALLIGLDMPEWLVQRVWMAVLLCAAFLGTVKLAEALGIGSEHTRILAGVAYALSPRVLTLLSYNSAELQPMMLLPWIVLPLVHGTRRGRPPLRAAALSALAFLLCGGTNAASELAVLVVPLIYLLSRAGGPRTWRLLGWWLTALFLVSFWWLVPLLLMGRYVFSFMPYTEDAATTTSVTTLTNALRGASNWMGYVPGHGQPALPAGAELSTEPWLVAVTALVAGLGIAGLVNRRTPERTFLVTTLLTGTAIVVAGYTGALTGPFAETMRGLLDGALSPFRNIHKFDALIRLPVVLGLAALPVAVARDAADRRALRTRRAAAAPGAAPTPHAAGPPPAPSARRLAAPHRVAAAACVLAVLATLTPLATVGVSTPGGFERIPGYWYEAAQWLDRHSGSGTTMAVPGSARGEYEWGRPMDEPMQPLMESAWTNHQIIPWGSAGVSRLNHEIDQRISSGRGSAGLADTLARMGVTHLLVRNDLQRDTINGGWPARVHQALNSSPGISHAVSFGPDVGSLDVQRAADWYDQPYRALDVYTVDGAAPRVGTVPAEDALRVTGGPEALLSLAEQGLLTDDRPVIIGDDPGAEEVAPEDTVVTDTARRREIVYSDVRRNVSNTLTAEEELERDAPAPDITDPAWADYTAVAEHTGIAQVRASSTESGANAGPTTRDPGRMPFAALDDAADTSWRSSGFTGAVGQWLEVEFSEPREVGDLTIAFEQIPGEPPPARISLITDDDRTTAPVAATEDPQEFTAPAGTTTRLRVRVDELAWEPEYRFGTRVGITGITLPGLQPERTLRVPGPADAGAHLFTGSVGTVPGCMEGSRVWVCNPGLAVQGEDAHTFDRSFAVSADAADGAHTITGQAVLTDPHDAENAANRAAGQDEPTVTSSSTSVEHPAAMGRNALDDDPATVWYPDPDERRPWLEVGLPRATELDGLRVEFPRADSVTRPVKVTVESGGTVREGWLDGTGWVGFAPLTARELTITFDPPEGQPLEVRGITLPGTDPLPPVAGGDAATACGLGPVLRVNGERVETRIVSGTLEDRLRGEPLDFASCSPVPLAEGANRLTVDPGNQYQVRSAVLAGADSALARAGADGDGGEEAGGAVRTAPVDAMGGWGRSERRFDVSVDEASFLVVNENFNDGWRATLEGADEPLEPVRLDGWKQAWRLPAGASGQVTLTYTPDTAYHAALGVGAVFALAVAVLAAVSARPVRPARRPTAPAARRARRERAALLPAAGPARLPRPLLAPLGVAYGVWVGGAAGAAVTAGALLLVWWLGRAPSRSLRHARPGRPALGGRLLGVLAGPWAVALALGCAGLSLGAGTYLALYYPFHDISELLSGPLREWVAQACCLPALARLVVALGEPVGSPAAAPPGGGPAFTVPGGGPGERAANGAPRPVGKAAGHAAGGPAEEVRA